MNIYELLNELISNQNKRLSKYMFTEELKDKLETELDRKIFEIVKNICSLGVDISMTKISFLPLAVIGNKRSFSIEDFSEDDYSLLESLDLERLPLRLQVRIADILWTEKRIRKNAIVASNGYLELFNLSLNQEEWFSAIGFIKRAISISLQVKCEEISNKAFEMILSKTFEISRYNVICTLRLLKIIIFHKNNNFNEIINIINYIIKNSNDSILNIEKAYALKYDLCVAYKKSDLAKKARLELADLYVNYADNEIKNDVSSVMTAENCLKKAVCIYNNYKEKTKAESVHRKLLIVQKEILKFIKPVSTTIDMSTAIDYIEKNFSNMSFEESILRLVQLTKMYTKEEIRKDILKNHSEFCLKNLLYNEIINKYGQTVIEIPPLSLDNPEADEKLMDLHINRKLVDLGELEGNLFIRYIVHKIHTSFEFKLDELDFLVSNNCIIPEGREKIFKSAVFMIFNEQYYEAIHILAPQIENLFRELARKVGAITSTIENDGSSREKVLSSIFDLPELVDCYDNDILFLFKSLMNEISGANIRNKVAHGLISEEEASSGIYLYFFAVTIKLLSYNSKETYKILKTNSRLQEFDDVEFKK